MRRKQVKPSANPRHCRLSRAFQRERNAHRRASKSAESSAKYLIERKKDRTFARTIFRRPGKDSINRRNKDNAGFFEAGVASDSKRISAR
jgi:hypothetical protein